MLKKNLKLIFTLTGFVFGVIVAHPYVMMVYVLTHPEGWKHPDRLSGLITTFAQLFSPQMFAMALSFAIFCAVIGFLLGALYERNKRLNEMRLEMQKKKEIMESMHRLLSVLSHFIINSTLVIGTNVRRLKRRDENGRFGEILESIEKEAKRNEEVIKLVNQCEFLENFEGADASAKISMDELLKLTRQIEKHLSA